MPSPDGTRAATVMDYTRLGVINLATGEREEIKLPRPGSLIRWASKDKVVLMQPGQAPIPLWTFDLRTHKDAPLWDLPLSDPSARGSLVEVVLSGDLRTYAYSYRQTVSELLLVNGWK
jgi:hypothetical protein